VSPTNPRPLFADAFSQKPSLGFPSTKLWHVLRGEALTEVKMRHLTFLDGLLSAPWLTVKWAIRSYSHDPRCSWGEGEFDDLICVVRDAFGPHARASQVARMKSSC